MTAQDKKAMVPIVKVAMPPRERLLPDLEKVLYSGMIGEGQHVYDFESRFSSQFGLTNTLATSSGTAALHLALFLSGVKQNTEVITTSMTAEPTNTTILNCGASPVFADVDPCSGNLHPNQVEALITDRTKAILVVHYAGYPADLHSLRTIADRYRVPLIEDCAHALGATFDEKPVGEFGDYAIFSFQAIKHMTTVDGGMLIVKDKVALDEARRLRWFGLDKRVPRTEVDISQPGFKYNMHNVAAVIGNAQLDCVGSNIARHQENGRFFDKALVSIAGLNPGKVLDRSNPSYWIYTLLTDDYDDVVRRLSEVGVMASKLHRPNHLHSAFRQYVNNLPALAEFYKRLVHIPCGWWVDDETRNIIVNALSKG